MNVYVTYKNEVAFSLTSFIEIVLYSNGFMELYYDKELRGVLYTTADKHVFTESKVFSIMYTDDIVYQDKFSGYTFDLDKNGTLFVRDTVDGEGMAERFFEFRNIA